jgi:hypothetical protein
MQNYFFFKSLSPLKSILSTIFLAENEFKKYLNTFLQLFFVCRKNTRVDNSQLKMIHVRTGAKNANLDA